MLAYVTKGDDIHVLGSLGMLATLLQTKGCVIDFSLLTIASFAVFLIYISPFSRSLELDESMLDVLGILPQRKQHKKLLLVCVILPF